MILAKPHRKRPGASAADATFQREALSHMSSLYQAARYLTRDDAAAEDLVQETLLKAHRFWHRYQEGTNCRAWLFRIQTNTFLNSTRKKSRTMTLIEDADSEAASDSLYEHSAFYGNPENQYLQGMLPELIQQALEELPENFRLKMARLRARVRRPANRHLHLVLPIARAMAPWAHLPLRERASMWEGRERERWDGYERVERAMSACAPRVASETTMKTTEYTYAAVVPSETSTSMLNVRRRSDERAERWKRRPNPNCTGVASTHNTSVVTERPAATSSCNPGMPGRCLSTIERRKTGSVSAREPSVRSSSRRDSRACSSTPRAARDASSVGSAR